MNRADVTAKSTGSKKGRTDRVISEGAAVVGRIAAHGRVRRPT
jgi:hypothetical protein